jgi:hypothetical protein
MNVKARLMMCSIKPSPDMDGHHGTCMSCYYEISAVPLLPLRASKVVHPASANMIVSFTGSNHIG